MDENIPAIEKILGYTFLEKELLTLAFTHRSYSNEHRGLVEGHNERLEFLGDSVLGLMISGYLYRHLPAQSEGHLSHLRASLVDAEACVRYTRQLDLEEYLLLGKGEAINVGRGRERLLANLFEAIIGAIYLDGGLPAAETFFLEHFSSALDQAMSKPLRNWKADLQDYAQKKTQKPPIYQVVEEEGPPHQRVFVIAVSIENVKLGRGEGPSKKEAEQTAAEDALRRIEKGEEDGQD
ncbi:MAG: Ribonuclease 3 [Chlamydiae bacterium]|nr:Ribonuclease 3 [Chlamydiota bacterium]